jgi:predicted membrane protein
LQADTAMNVRTGAADLDIYIPRDAGLKVKSGRFMSDLDFNNINMNAQDDTFISENYDTAKQKIEVDITSAMSEIEIFVQ